MVLSDPKITYRNCYLSRTFHYIQLLKADALSMQTKFWINYVPLIARKNILGFEAENKSIEINWIRVKIEEA